MEVKWRLHGRRTPEARKAMHFPPAVLAEHAKYFFSLIVPALDDQGPEAVPLPAEPAGADRA